MNFIPDYIMDVVIKYVDNKHLYDCNKYLNSLKYYKFNKKYSLKYYDDEQFRKLVQLKIPKNKLSLNFFECGNIIDVSMLGELHTLDLSFNKVTDVSMLSGLHTLNLCGCDNITDVSMLGKLHTLDLTGCNKITDVQCSEQKLRNFKARYLM